MKNRGKSINLFLIDGEANGRIKCTLSNWTGVAYKIPRIALDTCKNRQDLNQSGIYFLFGTSDQTNTSVVYVGQAGARKNGEGLLNRLQEHKKNPDKDYWTEAVVFTTSNNSFGPTEISYLENRFCQLAIAAKRYEVKNGNDPNQGNITEEKESELEEFVDNARIIMGTLGHRVFEPLVSTPACKKEDSQPSPELMLYFKRKSHKSGKTIQATCKRTNEGFVVLSGSQIEINDSESIPPGIKKARETAKISSEGLLQEDVLLTSPSYAAAFVIGGHANGLTEWSTSEGVTLKEFEKTEG